MKKDCPNCNQSMEGRFLQWRKFAKQDHFKACPICGKGLQFQMYPEEIAVRVLSVVVVIYGFYWAKERGDGWVPMLATVVAVIAAGFFMVNLRLKDKQRFRKG
jgi:uncharacterized protein (DUF983 family)